MNCIGSNCVNSHRGVKSHKNKPIFKSNEEWPVAKDISSKQVRFNKVPEKIYYEQVPSDPDYIFNRAVQNKPKYL